MDTPIIAQYYREKDPAKRRELLEQAIAQEGNTEENQVRKEIWDARYGMESDLGGRADGYLKFWMTIEFNRTSGNRWFTSKGARKGLQKELDQVLDDIYGAGYTGKLIIQDMIPGNDEYMRVLTSYSDHNGKVKMMCLGHVLLEEHTPHGLGNHAVIITEPNKELMMRVKDLLEELHYVGFSNFDIKYDRRDGKFKFFEINTRQGRSNYYVTGSGFNVAEYIVEDFVYGKELPLRYAKEEHLWMVVPKAVAFKYVKDPALKAKMKKLIKEKKVVNPSFMKGDLGMPRLARMIKTHLSHFEKYKKYYS